MPTASTELRDEWHDEGDAGAVRHLKSQGHILLWDFRWLLNKEPSEKSIRAMAYLIDEWDYGGWLTVSEFYTEIRDKVGKIKAERDRYREALGDAIKAAELAQESDSIRAGSMGDVEYGYFHEGPTVEELIEQSDALLNKARQALKGDT